MHNGLLENNPAHQYTDSNVFVEDLSPLDAGNGGECQYYILCQPGWLLNLRAVDVNGEMSTSINKKHCVVHKDFDLCEQ